MKWDDTQVNTYQPTSIIVCVVDSSATGNLLDEVADNALVTHCSWFPSLTRPYGNNDRHHRQILVLAYRNAAFKILRLSACFAGYVTKPKDLI